MSTLIGDVMSIADLITNTTEQAIRVFSEEIHAPKDTQVRLASKAEARGYGRSRE